MYQLSQIFWSFAGELFVAALLGVAAMIWGLFEGEKRRAAVIGGVVFMAAIVLILNQSGWWEPPVKVKIHQWLDDVSFSIRELPLDESSDFEFRFQVTAEMKAEPTSQFLFYVFQPKHGGNRFIWMEAGYDIMKSFPAIKNVSSHKMDQIHTQIKKDLAMRDVGYLFEKDGNIMATYMVPISSITQEHLLEGFRNLQAGMIIVGQDIRSGLNL